ncbi:VWA domain-containing protein [Streptomyces albireticuli]|uniref:VWA domain-containing protein n=1 Tax=Streptomyces albireticuli TaxID=1940 RepID=UPI003691ECE0
MERTTHLTPGGNMPLEGSYVRADILAPGREIDVAAVLLTVDGKVRDDNDLVFFNHPSHDGVSVHGATVTADFTRIPGAVRSVALVASVDTEQPGVVFDGTCTPRVDLVCGGRRASFAPPPMRHRESVVVVAEFYRRAGGWKVRAVGQGYDSGLAGLARDLGIIVDDPGPSAGTTAGETRRPTVPPPPPPPPPPSPPWPSMPPSPRPAVSLEKVRRTAPGLVGLYETAGTALLERGVAGERAAVYLALDHSASMRGFYADGTMQHLAEQALGLSAHLDDDGTVPLVFFSSGVDLIAEIGLGDYTGRIEALRSRLDWGGTCYAPAMKAIVEHYRKAGATTPAFVVFQTDGEPWDRAETRRLLRETSGLPIFWQFVGFGPSTDLRFLRSLDTLTGRQLDNAGYFGAGTRPRGRSDAALYDRLLKEFPDWLRAARASGLVT